jgi:hypothetical protein
VLVADCPHIPQTETVRHNRGSAPTNRIKRSDVAFEPHLPGPVAMLIREGPFFFLGQAFSWIKAQVPAHGPRKERLTRCHAAFLENVRVQAIVFQRSLEAFSNIGGIGGPASLRLRNSMSKAAEQCHGKIHGVADGRRFRWRE